MASTAGHARPRLPATDQSHCRCHRRDDARGCRQCGRCAGERAFASIGRDPCISRVDGGEFFERNGILFRSLDEVRRDTADMISAQPFLGTLAADPTLRGVLRTLSQSLEGVRVGKAELDDLRPALAAIADALEALANGKPAAFSWRTLIAGRPAKPSELRRFVNIQPVLDFNDLQPGRKATAADTRSDIQAWAHARTGRKGASHRIGRPVGRGI